MKNIFLMSWNISMNNQRLVRVSSVPPICPKLSWPGAGGLSVTWSVTIAWCSHIERDQACDSIHAGRGAGGQCHPRYSAPLFIVMSRLSFSEFLCLHHSQLHTTQLLQCNAGGRDLYSMTRSSPASVNM